MSLLFYISAAVAIVSTGLAISRLDAVHALLYLIVSLLSVALVFFTLGAPLIAALEVIIYAGAIMVLFIFVVMMLNLGEQAREQERKWLQRKMLVGPSLLTLILTVELIYALSGAGARTSDFNGLGPKQIGIALFGPYVLGVELASLLLLGGLIGAYHLGRRNTPRKPQGRPS